MWELAACVALIAALAIADYVRRHHWKPAESDATLSAAAPRAQQIEVARIEEQVRFSVVGRISIVMIILTSIILFWLLLVHPTGNSAVQETVIGVIWIAFNVLFGVGVLAGKRTTRFVWAKDEAATRSTAVKVASNH